MFDGVHNFLVATNTLENNSFPNKATTKTAFVMSNWKNVEWQASTQRVQEAFVNSKNSLIAQSTVFGKDVVIIVKNRKEIKRKNSS